MVRAKPVAAAPTPARKPAAPKPKGRPKASAKAKAAPAGDKEKTVAKRQLATVGTSARSGSPKPKARGKSEAAKGAGKRKTGAPDPFVSSGMKPTSAPMFTPDSKDIYGYWHGKWYEVEVLKPAQGYEKGQHVYLIRWTKDVNTAKPGDWATNESYYPENWIFAKADIAPHQLPGAGATKPTASPAKGKTPRPPAKPKATPAANNTAAGGYGFGVFQASLTPGTTHKYPYKWQYFDDKKPTKGTSKGWHDYDLSGSDVVEEAYQSWVTDPYIDVRAVHSGDWNYMVDFNQMQQTNVDHAAHTVRAIRRVRVDDESDAMDEQRTIRRQVSLHRLTEQTDQLASGGATSSSALQRVPSHRGPQAQGPEADPASSGGSGATVGAGDLVRVPSGRSGIVLTTSGGPSLPVQVQFPDGATQFLEASDVQRE